MRETLLAMLALFMASSVSLQGRKAAHAHTSSGLTAEVQMAALGVAQGTLDAAAALPFEGTASAPAAHVESARVLAELSGLADAVSVSTASGTALRLDLAVTVEPVDKVGEQFQVATAEASYRRVRAVVIGPLGVRTELERVYVGQL
jgi:hypothetical protein